MRQLADVRPDYHTVKNYKLLGRFDTLFVKDADFFRVLPAVVRRGRIAEKYRPLTAEHGRDSVLTQPVH